MYHWKKKKTKNIFMRVPKKTVLPQGWGKMVQYHIHAKHLEAEWNPGHYSPMYHSTPDHYKTILPQSVAEWNPGHYSPMYLPFYPRPL
jgi:hypothetical protein